MNIEDTKIPLIDLLYLAIHNGDDELVRYVTEKDPDGFIAVVSTLFSDMKTPWGITVPPAALWLAILTYNIKMFKMCIDAVDFSHGHLVNYLGDFFLLNPVCLDQMDTAGATMAMMSYGTVGYVASKLADDTDLRGAFLGDREEVNWYNPNGGTKSADDAINDAMTSDDGPFTEELGWFFLDGLESLYGVRPNTAWEITHPKPKEDTV